MNGTTYTVMDKKTGMPVKNHDSVLWLPNGKIAWWDDSRGWTVDEDQNQFEVVLLVPIKGETSHGNHTS